jgi:4'-phosphopantetheinyl transferase
MLAWPPAPDGLELRPGEAHIWAVSIDISAAEAEALRPLLSDDEIQRADRFHFDRHRSRFIAARAGLRTVLARYLGAEPASLRFAYEHFGKPYLDRRDGRPPLEFNLSHSADLALIGVCLSKRIGIDIEHRVQERATLDIARNFFAAEEVAALEGLPPESQTAGFFACWTRKEAYIKARGEGISLGLDTFAVTLAPGEPPRLIRSALGELERKRWLVRNLDVHPGYAAALVIEQGEWDLRCWQGPRYQAAIG